MNSNNITNNKMKVIKKRNKRFIKIKNNYELYLFMLLPFLYFIVFKYIPMYGVQLAFKDFIASKGIWGSEWVGFDHFIRFFNAYYFWDLIKNTVGISLYTLIAGFPIPIVFALMVNEIRKKYFSKFVQTITYAPHFISIVVLVGMLIAFLSPTTGLINNIRAFLGLERIAFLQDPKLFKSIYVWSGIWQNLGWSSIIYLAALAGVPPESHEAAVIDGASIIQRIIHINLPSIAPTIVILFILRTGGVLSVGFEKIFLMQNSLNMSTSDVISTYVYRAGLVNSQFSFASAVGLFNSVVNCLLLIIVNQISRKISETSLW